MINSSKMYFSFILILKNITIKLYYKTFIFYSSILVLFGCKKNNNTQQEILGLDKSIHINVLKTQFDTIEKNIKEKHLSEFQKEANDLDGDGDNDLIYVYQCGEPQCIDVYINVNGKLEKSLSELCYKYSLDANELHIERNHCCGESPFTSFRSFSFINDKFVLKENYVLFNDSEELLAPKQMIGLKYNSVIVQKANYNVRFSPSIRTYKEEESYFSCEEYTNIIGKLKKGSKLKVLAEKNEKYRTWLFVEIEEQDLESELCSIPMTYDNKNQKLRAWISNEFIKIN